MNNLLILGASARAAAQSAVRAGYRVAAGDLFADRDLVAIAEVIGVPPGGYASALQSIAAKFPHSPWMYVGGLENYPRLVDRIGRQRPLWGNSGDVLRHVRNPFRLAAAWKSAGIAAAEVSPTPPRVACQERWLRKRRRGTGGRGVSFVTEIDTNAKTSGAGRWYYQQWIGGPTHAAVFVAAAGKSRLLGVTRQWVHCDCKSQRDTGLPPFGYLGSVGPLCLSVDTRAQWQAIGDVLAGQFGLRGLFGVDSVCRGTGGDHTLWPVEVNPRYTASAEILERAWGISLVHLHVQACAHAALPDSTARSGSPQGVHGKAIVYAPGDGHATDQFLDAMSETDHPELAWPVAADLPHGNAKIREHQPVLTIFAGGETAAEVSQSLGLTDDNGGLQRAAALWHAQTSGGA